MTKRTPDSPMQLAPVAACALWLALLSPTLLSPAANADAAKGEAQAAPTNPFAGDEAIVALGRTQFNIHCSHCHGPNAIQGERPRDLRRLERRYKENMTAVFLKTVTNGRPEKGMPPWKGVVPEEELWKIYTFLETIQK